MRKTVLLNPKQKQVITRKLAEAKFTRLMKGILETKTLTRDQKARMIVDLKKKLKL